MIRTQKTGAYLSQLRKQQNLTQADLARQLLVSPQAVSKWETGQALPDPEQLLALSQRFGVSVNALLLGEDRPDDPLSTAGVPAAPAARGEEEPEEPVSWERDLDAVLRLAPFVEPAVLQELLPSGGLGSLPVEQLAALAPFLDRELLDRFMEEAQERAVGELAVLLPFVSPAALERLAERLEGTVSTQELAAVAPFLSQEWLGELFRRRMAQEEKEGRVNELAVLAPFVPSSVLEEVLEAQPLESLAEWGVLLPFLDRAVVARMLRRLLGSSDPGPGSDR